MEIDLHVAPRPMPPVCSSYKYRECLFTVDTTVDTTHLTPLIFPLLIMPGLDLNQPIDWDEIEEFEGGILFFHQKDCGGDPHSEQLFN